MTITHFFLALLVVCVWGFNFVAIRVGLNGFPPLFLVFLRFFLTSIPALFFIKKPKTSFKKIACYGLVMFALQFSLLFIGIGMGVAPGLASLITQIQVFFSIFLGVIFFKEMPHKWQIIGSIISFAGLIVVAMHVEGTLSLEGFLFLIGAALFWSIGNLLSKKIGKIDTLSLVIWSSLIAWPPLLFLSLILEGPKVIYKAVLEINTLTVLSTLYITYCSTLLGYGLWSYLINHIPLGTISSFTILIPIIAMLSSVLLLGEPLQSWKILAAILVLSGLSINLFRKKLLRFYSSDSSL
jgi:O-acetylserine/cysteine efflux transporter